MMRTRLRAILSLLLILCAVGSACLAESGEYPAPTDWDVAALIALMAERVQTAFPEHLLAYVQPVDQTFENDQIRVHLTDAVYDGSFCYLAWTIENKTNELLHVTQSLVLDGTNVSGAGVNAFEVFLSPRETRAAGIGMDIEEAAPEENASGIAYCANVLRPLGEVIEMYARTDIDWEDQEAVKAAIEAVLDAGNIPHMGYGFIHIGEREWPEGMVLTPDMPQATMHAESTLRTGLLERLSILNGTATLTRNTWRRSALPDGEPIDRDFGNYQLRVTKADLSPAVLHIALEMTFPNEAIAMAYSETFGEWHDAPRWGFVIEDEAGEEILFLTGQYGFHDGTGSGSRPPIRMPGESTFYWAYIFNANGLMRIPEAVTITPYWLPVGEVSEDARVLSPEEAITLDFSE